MNSIEIAFEEFKNANERYNYYRESKIKVISVILTIMLGLFTFIIKGDLPNTAYLILSFCQVISIVLFNYHTHRQVIYGNVALLAEHKINLIAKNEQNIDNPLTFLKNYYSLVGANYYTSKSLKSSKVTTTIFIGAILVALFELTLILGLLDYNVNIIIICHIVTYVIISIYLIKSINENKKRREILINLIENQKNCVQQRFCAIAGLALAILFFMDNNLVITIISSKEML